MSRARQWVEMMLDQGGDAEGDLAEQLAENFEYLLDHVDDWEAGEILPGDLPNLGDEEQAVIIYATLFGTLWELSHPSLWLVLDVDGRFVGCYGHEENARDRAEDNREWQVHRTSVADGDKDPEAIIGDIGGGAE